ncbi:MAG: protein phosphatase 2C domain-containing protein [Verrucomicrobiia bacterium]|jgi:protein phosphatase
MMSTPKNNPRLASTAKRLQWSGRTDRGKVRPNNEDAFLGIRFDSREIHRLGKFGEASTGHMDFAFAVSDGMGGELAGEYASQIAVEKITALLPRSFQQSAVGLEAGFGDVLTELFDQIHRALQYLGGNCEECAGMETTLSLCWFTPGWMYFGHIGDSRIYYLPAREGGIRQLSQDDTYVGWLFRNGKISEREARIHPRRNLLQKALGGGNQFVDPQVGAVAYEAGDIFLLCTDGLVEGLYDHHLVELLRPPGSAGIGTNPAHRLVEAALEKDGGDNTTALVIQVI